VNILSACSRETACSERQPFGRKSFHGFARNDGIKFDHGFAALDRRIRAAGDNAIRLSFTSLRTGSSAAFSVGGQIPGKEDCSERRCGKSALSLDGLAKF
jgi:hypothetical protein